MGSAINLDEIKRFEITEIYCHPDAKVDIVLVHGLNGDPRKTWTGKESKTFWPTQLLPVSLKSAQARILVYGYNADVYAFGGGNSASSDMIHHHAQTLITNLANERKSEEVEEHPIIFVAHSLGGILVKRALELSNDLTSKNADDARSIFVSTYGIIFMGTPHNGADPAKWGVILTKMVSIIPKKIMHTESQLVKTLKANNETLQNINVHFLDIYQKFKICMVHEAAPTPNIGFVVDKDSAAPMLPDVQYFGIEATHSGMVKFDSKNSPGYMNVSTTLKSWVQECGPTIQARWENEKRQRWQTRQAQAAELLGAFQPTPQPSTMANTPDPSKANSMNNSTMIVTNNASIEPSAAISDETASQIEARQWFIKPSGFRPNSLFEGRQTELAELHKMLFDRKRRAEGTAAVLIQSMPGGGKSHLAREYVYRHRAEYPGGIFWLRAKSTAELAAGFWDVARKAVFTNLEDGSELSAMEKDSDQYIRVVRRWFNHRQGWLMVLDGIHFNETNELRKYIPDSIDTGLIYTSTEKSVSGNHLFMNPQVIKLPLLSAREAQRLLLLELDRKEPFSKDDLKNSMELVQSMGFLPVVIHAVAQRLKSTEEPLARFARNYANEPRLRGLESYQCVVKQLKILGASETLNLIYILCFFSQHIPVEMISLGLKALDSPYHVPVKATEPISGKSLNNTFKMLNTFALIDRNEQEPVSTMNSSQTSKGSRDMLSENVDVIRLHSVVQGFFVDTLAGAGSLPIWLDHAVRLFCCSYDKAHSKILNDKRAGLVEDYRLYEIHGIKIREHLIKHLAKHPKEDEKTILEAAQEALDKRLQGIKEEIETRTPESSHVIAEGMPDVFQTSIFDRTSSSSDTGPETPGSKERNPSKVSTWGFEVTRNQFESPTTLMQEGEFNQQHLQEIYKNNFLPLDEDTGYDSDRESATAMTVQPSQRTARASSFSNSEVIRTAPDGWEVVPPRRRPQKQVSSSQHRSVRTMERQRYRDSAGAYRAVTTADPRLTRENALGYFPSAITIGKPRGRVDAISGHSNAEVSLASISKNSPPPGRGGGMIQDRRPSSLQRPRMMTGLSSYAAAVAGSTKDTILGWRESVTSSRPGTADKDVVPSSDSSLSMERPTSSAIESLQKFPIEIIKPGSSPKMIQTAGAAPKSIPISILPYPTTPIRSPNSARKGTYPFPAIEAGRKRGTSTSGSPNSYPTTIYPRMEDGPIFETLHHSSPRFISSPPLRDNSHSPPFLSLSFPDIRSTHPHPHPLTNNTTYYPGHPEFTFPNTAKPNGYSSQPMSRDPSGTGSKSTSNPSGRSGRTPSIAETEPLPSLPMLSPSLPPTSYQIYETQRLHGESSTSKSSPRLTREEWERESPNHLGVLMDRRASQELGGMKRSPRLEYARSALIEELGEGKMPSPPSTKQHPQFNPAALPFAPSYTFSDAGSYREETGATYPHSPYIPAVPPNSTLTSTHAASTGHPSPNPAEGEEMSRSSSGGVKIGGQIIEFGDFPEKVNVDVVRERAWRRLKEQERVEKERELEREREKERKGLGIFLER